MISAHALFRTFSILLVRSAQFSNVFRMTYRDFSLEFSNRPSDTPPPTFLRIPEVVRCAHFPFAFSPLQAGEWFQWATASPCAPPG